MMIKEQIVNLIVSGRNEEAIKMLLAATKEKDEVLNNQLIVISSQLSSNIRRSNQGIISLEDLKLSENKINESLLNCLNQIEDGGYFEGESLESLTEKSESKATDSKKRKILFVASNPKGTPKFELEKEYLGIRKIFRDKRNEFEVIELFDTKLDDLFEYIQREQPDILHISAPSTNEFLCLHEEDNSIAEIPYKFLSSAFLMFKEWTNCLFMNTWTSPIFLKRASKSLGYSIGSSGLISDENSILFSSGFYTGISLGKGIEEAFKLGMEVVEKSERASNVGLETLLLFKNGFCLNKPDQFPENFPTGGPSSYLDQKESAANQGE
jgi:hypothetical protein